MKQLWGFFSVSWKRLVSYYLVISLGSFTLQSFKTKSHSQSCALSLSQFFSWTLYKTQEGSAVITVVTIFFWNTGPKRDCSKKRCVVLVWWATEKLGRRKKHHLNNGLGIRILICFLLMISLWPGGILHILSAFADMWAAQ